MTGRVGLLGTESVSLRTSEILTLVVKVTNYLYYHLCPSLSRSMTTISTPRKDLVFLVGSESPLAGNHY